MDDDPICLEAIGLHFETAGIIYTAALNGLEALNIINEKLKVNEFFDLIIMDCEMPIMDGFTASKEIKDLEKKEVIPHIPIIALTGNISNEDIMKCQSYKMDYTLAKPVTKKLLFSKINDIFPNLFIFDNY